MKRWRPWTVCLDKWNGACRRKLAFLSSKLAFLSSSTCAWVPAEQNVNAENAGLISIQTLTGFLRNWRSVKKNKNQRGSWGFCGSLKKKFTCRCRSIKLLLLLISLMLPHELLLLLLLASSFSPTFSFSLFYSAANLNAKFWNLWSVMGSEKGKSSSSLFTHPNGYHVAYRWSIFYSL